MVSKPFPSSSPSLRRIASAVNARRYVIGGVCLLIAAGALRFYDLGANSLWYDEAVTSLHSQGTLSDVVDNTRYGIANVTRYGTNAPILYPIALWAVQQIESSNFSVRVVSATASLLTVGALLFLMPRVGVPRRAAFLAALLAAVSVAAIEEAQDASVHSLGALNAALIIAGVLLYLRDGKKALLCGALFVGPMLHYGLVPFGAGALAAATVAANFASRTPGPPRSYPVVIWQLVKPRADLLLPTACYAAGGAIGWAFITSHQWTPGGWAIGSYLADYYYSGFHRQKVVLVGPIIEFGANRGWSALSYLMPPALAVGALAAFGLWQMRLVERRRSEAALNAIALLALFAFIASLCAAMASLYPFGGIRHNLYLGPIAFLAAGGGLHSIADDLAAILRRAWAGTALALAAGIAIAVIGASAIWQDDLYDTDNSIERVLAALDEREREGDGVYVSRWAIPPVAFYKGGKPANYHYEQAPCPGTYEAPTDCVYEALDEMFKAFNASRRIWLIYNADVSAQEEIAAYSPTAAREVAVEEIAADGRNALYLITGFEGVAKNIRVMWRDMYNDVTAEAPSAVSDYNLYLHPQDYALYYAKRPCDASDTAARFFLHLYPADAADLPEWRRGQGFDNLDFDFSEYGFTLGDRCIIRRELPEYPIERIHAGQFAHPDGPVVWEAELEAGPPNR